MVHVLFRTRERTPAGHNAIFLSETSIERFAHLHRKNLTLLNRGVRYPGKAHHLIFADKLGHGGGWLSCP